MISILPPTVSQGKCFLGPFPPRELHKSIQCVSRHSKTVQALDDAPVFSEQAANVNMTRNIWLLRARSGLSGYSSMQLRSTSLSFSSVRAQGSSQKAAKISRRGLAPICPGDNGLQ